MARRVTGEPVTFVRGDLTIDIPLATRGATNWNQNAPFNGVRIGDRSTDWIFPILLLVDLERTQLVPERGDVIVSDSGTFRVMPFGPDSQLWQYHDRESRQMYRIHTKERN
jgi:hypothetical protein